jgi:UDP-glucose 4-epimerase
VFGLDAVFCTQDDARRPPRLSVVSRDQGLQNVNGQESVNESISSPTEFYTLNCVVCYIIFWNYQSSLLTWAG